MKISTILILIIITTITIFLFIIFSNVKEINDFSSDLPNDISGDNSQEESNEETLDSLPNSNSDLSGSGGGISDSSSQNNLPNDFDTAPCGIYFQEYNVCGGSCADGECTSEGRSCYCKKV